MIRATFFLVILFTQSMLLNGQESESHYVLETDSSWFKEIFTFPIGFAQEIEYVGIEDARFPPGWSKEASPEFWSYIFAWHIERSEKLTANELESNLKLYFDGLLGLRDKSENQKTKVTLVKNDIANVKSSFIGEVNTLDTRYTKKPMTLNVLVEEHACEQQNKSIILLRFSPKEFYHDVWQMLDNVKLRDSVCKY
jgi:hypothetical protein